MSNKVHIAVTAGPMKGKAFAFDEHDTFLFGRLTHCASWCPTAEPAVTGSRKSRDGRDTRSNE